MTIRGPIDPNALGRTLAHEHILVDFIGARLISQDRWNRDEVMDKVLPYLDELSNAGCHTLIDCTPNFLGRDVLLLKALSSTTGLNIITNTGYYGGSDNKFLPQHAFAETDKQLSTRWINEWKSGIEKTEIKPGFIKISVNAGTLSDISQKLIRAAGLTHISTGLSIASHTGPAIAAFEQLELLKQQRIDPSAFIWVHAQAEKDASAYVEAARRRAWVSLDGLSDENIASYVEMLAFLKKENCLDRVLLSHDAGWYDPGKPGGGPFRDYTTLFRKMIPALQAIGFSESDIHQLLVTNPKEAYTIRVRRTNN